MDWYYSDGRQQFGPVTQAEFDTLVASGRIAPHTLVWRAGMTNWAPLETVQAPSPATTAIAVEPAPEAPEQQVRFCSQCGKPYAPGDLLQIGNVTFCAACKDVMMQRLREGALPGGLAFQGRQYGGFWIRFAAVLIDSLVLGVVGAIIDIPFNLMMGGMMMTQGTRDPMAFLGPFMGFFSIMVVISMAIALAYESWFVVNKGATPGKMVLSLEVIREDGTRPGWGLAIGRYFAKILSSWPTLWIGYIMAGIDDEKRGLHDRICNTRVIRK